jgi:hypothetical protein
VAGFMTMGWVLLQDVKIAQSLNGELHCSTNIDETKQKKH